MRDEREEPAYTKEEINERMKKTYGDSAYTRHAEPHVKVKKPYVSPSTKAAVKKGFGAVGGYLKQKAYEAYDTDTQIKKTRKKAELAEARVRLARAKKKLRSEQNLGYSLGGPLLGNQQSNFEAGFSDMMAGKKHPKKAKKSGGGLFPMQDWSF